MKIEVLGAERRRRWRHEDKIRIVEESFGPGTVVCDVARRHEIAIASCSVGDGKPGRAVLGAAGGNGICPGHDQRSGYEAAGERRCGRYE